MPNLRSSYTVSSGLLIGVAFSILVFFIQPALIHSLVYTTYAGLIDTLELYELAWILGTIDYLLNFTFIIPLILWIALSILVALLIRKMSATLTIISIAILLPSCTWLLFTTKYAIFAGFTISFLLSFFLWQVLVPLGITLSIAALVSFPFWILQRRQPAVITAPDTVCFVCSQCGAQYHSKPLICVQCGEEGKIEEA
jgi:hypothetical protein